MNNAKIPQAPSKDKLGSPASKQADIGKAAHWMRLLNVGAERSAGLNRVAVLSAN